MIKDYLHDKNNFETGVSSFIPFLVEDRNLITARWPNDVEKLANKLAEKLK